MERKPYVSSEEKSEQLGNTVQEEKVQPLDLASEIYPLLEDYFYGTFVRNTSGVLIKMPNGQVFQLTVLEVG